MDLRRLPAVIILGVALAGCVPVPAAPMAAPSTSSPPSTAPSASSAPQGTASDKEEDFSSEPLVPHSDEVVSIDPTSVPGCEAGCEVFVDLPLPDGERFIGLNADVDSATQVVLTLQSADGEFLAALPIENAFGESADCSPEGKCIVTSVVGPYSSAAAAVSISGDTITVTDQVQGTVAGAVPVDLDGDENPDLALMAAGEGPSVSAPRYWETYQEVDGILVLTGCSALATEEEPVPLALLSGPCPPA
jgi:hypothetical protein